MFRYTLRFPRVERVRVFKGAGDVLDYAGLLEMVRKPHTERPSRHNEVDEAFGDDADEGL